MNDEYRPSREQRRKTIQDILTNGGHYTRTSLARRFNTSTKSIQRDMDHLRDKEMMPIESGKTGYYLRKASKAEAERADERYVASLILTGSSIDRNFAQVCPEVALNLKTKFLKLNGLPMKWDAGEQVTSVSEIKLTDAQLKVFGILSRLILNETPTTIEYRGRRHCEAVSKEVYPIQLKEREGIWYLVAYDYGKQADRSFALTGIMGVKASLECHTPVSDEVVKRNLARGAFSIWEQAGQEAQKVEVKLYDYAAWFVRDQVLHPSQVIEEVSQDEVLLSLETSDLLGVQLWLRKFAPFVEVVEPLALREALVKDMEACLARNQGA